MPLKNIADTSVIITAAGSGSRMNTSVNKILLPLKGRPVLNWSLQIFDEQPRVREIVVAAGAKDMAAISALIQGQHFAKPVKIIEGGATRAESVKRALGSISADSDLIAVHDGARPLLTVAILEEVLQAAVGFDGAIVVVPVKETVKRVSEDVVFTLPRNSLYISQTPQVFPAKVLRRAYDRPDLTGFYDDSALVEDMGGKINIVCGSYENIKLTTFEDFILAGLLMDRREKH